MNYSIPKQLLSKAESNAKLSKGLKYGWDSFILYLAPYNQNSKGVNLCPHASALCVLACLFTAGRGRMSNVEQARRNRTEYYLHDRKRFLSQIVQELTKIAKHSNQAVRLNGTSDIDWLKMFKAYGWDLLEMFPSIEFYDYTKSLHRWLKYRDTRYHLTFSRSESNEAECLQVLSMGGNVAVVFDELPETWNGYKVVNGDDSDLRFLDESGVVVGLTAKGKAKGDDASGFVVRTTTTSVEQWDSQWIYETI